ncbi:hypothetical protein [Pectobacterium versatile]|uniref:hypothetical protein n=1 Tax=Pectobacterium versatile TaxID=2488639 RepID=UPI00102F1118|nr:hypothetical protein [Pectobacterium versatile]MBN3195122.1 hypothetical protein [Pectobacterium versatile]TAI94848.1 hypothetical protein EG335_16610 [Pectobacterium versatile]
MAKVTNRNIWDDNKIPSLEYCSILRATDLLGCRIEDILHFAEIGAIELCIKLEGFKASITSPLRLREPDVWENGFHNHPLLNKYQVNSSLSLFSPYIEINSKIYTDEKPVYTYEYSNSPGLKKPCILLYGLWSLKLLALSDAHFFSKITSPDGMSLSPLDFSLKEADEPFSYDDINSDALYASPITEYLYPNGLLDQKELKPIVTLTTSDLYLTKKQIELIYDGIGKSLPSYVSGEVEKTENPINIIKAGSLTVHQFSFIYSLLKMLDISDDKIINSSPSELNKILSTLAASKGLTFTPPDKNTWAKWREKFPSK